MCTLTLSAGGWLIYMASYFWKNFTINAQKFTFGRGGKRKFGETGCLLENGCWIGLCVHFVVKPISCCLMFTNTAACSVNLTWTVTQSVLAVLVTVWLWQMVYHCQKAGGESLVLAIFSWVALLPMTLHCTFVHYKRLQYLPLLHFPFMACICSDLLALMANVLLMSRPFCVVWPTICM